MKSQTNSLDLALSNKYFELSIQFLESKIFNKKVDVFYFIEKNYNYLELRLNILGSTHRMIISKFLYD